VTDTPNTGAAAEAALRHLADGSDQQLALGELARADVLLPDVGDPAEQDGDPQMVQLPVAQQQDGTQLVPAFTSEEKMVSALPGVSRYRAVRVGALGGMWPSDDLVLAIDPGTDTGITLPADGVKALAALGG
jgi:hypothetical protein